MAFFGWATIPILLLLPSFFFLGIAGGRLGDALQRERIYVRQRLLFWNWLAAAVALGIVNAADANPEITHIVLWKRVLLRGIRLLFVSLNAICCFILFDSAAGIHLGLRVGDDSSAVSSACAVVVIAMHLPLWWMAVFED